MSELGLPERDMGPEFFCHGGHSLLQVGQGLVDVQGLYLCLSHRLL